MQVVKRNGEIVEFQLSKIEKAIKNCFNSVKSSQPSDSGRVINAVKHLIGSVQETITVEEIQDLIERVLMSYGYFEQFKSFVLYREKHKETRFIKERLDYMNKYSQSADNAATASETDANANVTMKNVANLEGEVYKTTNRIIQRQRMKEKLNELFPEVTKQYEEDLNNHIIYVHDEASSPCAKFYCLAASLYPLMLEGTGNIDGVTPTPPNDIQSFSGQVTNLVFLLSSQAKGAVALGGYIIALNYYVKAEFGDKWREHLNDPTTSSLCLQQRTIKDSIRKGMKQFIYGVNQPAGNRSYNSPFSNLNFFDKYYFNALFKDFYYPDGTQPEWEDIDILQRIFLELHRDLRLIKPLTFPVTTMCMLHNGKDCLDSEYKQLCADEWAKGGSFFCYLSDNPNSVSSCCRVMNEIQENTFSSTTGLTGIMTGSCNVITLNLNRITQDYFKTIDTWASGISYQNITEEDIQGFQQYLINILERVYKYQIAYKTILYELEDKGMFSSSNAGYIYMKKLYSTIGIIGYCEAAQYLGMEISDNEYYKKFLQLILGTIKEQNKKHSIRDKKKPFLFNSEAVPGENLAIKFYEWDKADGYVVPEDQNLYSSYFFKQWDNKLTVLDKLRLHGRDINKYCDGGQACHLHLDAHLSSTQYLNIIDFCVKEGVNYFTFNIPISECKDCGHVVNAPVAECPKCHSKNIDYWVRIIGFLRPFSSYSQARFIEVRNRIYSDGRKEIK